MSVSAQDVAGGNNGPASIIRSIVDLAGDLAGVLEAYRQNCLLDRARFDAHPRDPDAMTIVLDTRSTVVFAQGYLGGAVNLPFSYAIER